MNAANGLNKGMSIFIRTTFIGTTLALAFFSAAGLAQESKGELTSTSPDGLARKPKKKVRPQKRIKVYVAQLQTGAGAETKEVALLNDTLMVSFNRHRARYDFRTFKDVQALLDLEADKLASGCSDSACAAEVANALDAEELITGEVGKVGETWILNLTRIGTENLQALGRTQVRAQGEHADVLLAGFDDMVDEVLGRKAPAAASKTSAGVPPLTTMGALGAASGALIFGASGGFHLSLFFLFDNAKTDSLTERKKLAANGPLLNGLVIAGYVVGSVVAIVGIGVVGAGILTGELE